MPDHKAEPFLYPFDMRCRYCLLTVLRVHVGYAHRWEFDKAVQKLDRELQAKKTKEE